MASQKYFIETGDFGDQVKAWFLELFLNSTCGVAGTCWGGFVLSDTAWGGFYGSKKTHIIVRAQGFPL